MAEINLKGKEKSLFKEVPWHLSDSEVLLYIQSKKIGKNYINILKSLTRFNDEILSAWLNINVKTFRSYKDSEHNFKDNTKEQIVLLLALIKHGYKVFDTTEEFETWLSKPNFFFDNHAPISFLNTVSGIRFVDDRLTALEYGDNV